MKTSQQWWDEVKASTEKLVDWLKKQYTGEVTAAARILDFSNKFTLSTKNKAILSLIATQERIHSEWIKELLITRNITPEVGDPNKRYWKETLPGISDFETGTAVAAHAEKMRLERIEVISNDENAPTDVREAFKKILKDERFHEAAFRNMSTQEALNATSSGHENGMNALGLVA